MSKYHSQKITVQGIEFDSKKEAYRFAELRLLERSGVISDLRRQVKFELIPKQNIPFPYLKGGRMKRTERAEYYIADFVYQKDGRTVVEDVKGYRTDAYDIKRKQMLYRYGIQVMET